MDYVFVFENGETGVRSFVNRLNNTQGWSLRSTGQNQGTLSPPGVRELGWISGPAVTAGHEGERHRHAAVHEQRSEAAGMASILRR
jgi:hypothetical protein